MSEGYTKAGDMVLNWRLKHPDVRMEDFPLIRFISQSQKISLDDAMSLYGCCSPERRKEFTDAYEEMLRRIEEEESPEYQKRKRIEENFKDLMAEIPERFKDVEMDDFKGLEIHERANEAVSSDRNWVVFGSNGVGKTRLAYAMMKIWCGRDESFGYVTATKLSSEIRVWIMQGSDVCDRLESAYGRHIRHLIIDEMDKVKMSENFLAFFSHIIDYRYSHLKQTIVFGNMEAGETPEELLGRSVWSRLRGEDAIKASFWKDDDRRVMR